jgi:predicted CXXCH cytochrome family protein
MSESKNKSSEFPLRALMLLVLGVCGVGAALYFLREPALVAPAASINNRTERPPVTNAAFAGSQSCQTCHPQAFEAWQKSNHALAERTVDPTRDKIFFEPAREIKHGTQTSSARIAEGKFELLTRGEGGTPQTFLAERVIGYHPLHQYIVPISHGRMQVAELAVDPDKKEWFDVFGSEDRQPGEWGHWSGRGMTWNSMCAACHNTFVQKNFDAAKDSYATTMAERSIGCESCHGPQTQHVAWQQQAVKTSKKEPGLKRLNGEQYFAVCGSCHARRSELTGQFVPGDAFADHFSPVLPNETETYYADGQVHDENFEYVSFLGSRMHGQGVRCTTCHEPHGGKLRVAGNALCLQCHNGKIDPAAHSHHKPDSPGGNCVDCHMPQTAYMQRHLRRDHGMTIPDPQLTKEHGVPNACNRCHLDKKVEWAADAVEKWYGAKMLRSTQTRARIIARTRAGAPDAFDPLLKLAREEIDPFWKAVAADLLGRYSARTEARDLLVQFTQHGDPLLRSAAIRAVDTATSQADVRSAIEKCLNDPVRAVRIDAAWALRMSVSLDSRANAELQKYFDQNADFPSSVLQRAIFHMDRKQPQIAVSLLKQAIGWDPNSVQLRQALATAASQTGDSAESVRQLEKSAQLDPRNAQLRFSLGLAHGELGHLEQATQAFKDAVAIDPRFARAWYNLGLAYSKAERSAEALDALARAEAADSTVADYPYVRAIVLANAGKVDEAREAIVRTLQLDLNHEGARNLLRQIGPPRQ